MIFTNIIVGLGKIVEWLLSLLPQLPPVPQFITTNVNAVLDFIFQHVQLFEVFVPLELVGVLLPLSLLVANLNRLWGVIRLIYRLIPIVGKN